MTFLDAMRDHDRDQLDARAAAAEQERDEAIADRDQARAALAGMTELRDEALSREAIQRAARRQLQRELDGLRNDHRSALRANLELTAANAKLRRQLGDAEELIAEIRNNRERDDRAFAAYDTATPTTPPVDIRDGSLHVGRAFTGTEIEDTCPCAQAPCGLVVQGTADPICTEHPTNRAKTMRQIHRADQCPASEPTEDLRSPLAAERDSLVETIGRLVSLPPDDIARMHKVGYTGTSAAAPVPSAPAQESHTVAQEQHSSPVANSVELTLAGAHPGGGGAMRWTPPEHTATKDTEQAEG